LRYRFLLLSIASLLALGHCTAASAANRTSGRLDPNPPAVASTAPPVTLSAVPEAPMMAVPLLSSPPHLEDFLEPSLRSSEARKMLRIGGFVQRYPLDGTPVTEATTAYLGSTPRHLYIAFICKDRHPNLIRAHMKRRDALGDDDFVEVTLDTFRDRRRAFVFQANPLGIEADALYSEQTGADFSFDTVWDSWGKVTPYGYVVLIRIPFASLRFSQTSTPGQPRTWGLVLQRVISHENENAFWPQIKREIAGRLTQDALVSGFADVQQGHNIQFEPYFLAHSYRTLNTSDSQNPHFNNKELQGFTGLDTKIVLHNSLVLDTTYNPDFSQVDINDPAPPNQRFQPFFPEQRPFFLENSSYFSTPINLYYTNNIVIPRFGERLTGKVGPWAVGILDVDDRKPGQNAAAGTAAYGTRARNDVIRLNRDVGAQSSVGLIYADREYRNTYNRIGGADYRYRFKERWTLTGQAVSGGTESSDATKRSGQSYVQSLSYSGTHANYWVSYNDTSPGFQTRTGFFRRPDIREGNGGYSYTFRPSRHGVLSHGPSIYAERIWDHRGVPLDVYSRISYSVQMAHRTSLYAYMDMAQERLRPADYSMLATNVEYHNETAGFSFYTSPLQQIAVGVSGYSGRVVNYSPAVDQPPSPVDVSSTNLNVEVKPTLGLDLQNRYEFDHFTDPASGALSYDNHLVVTRWNLQMNKALSFRIIGEYLSTIPNEKFTDLPNTRDVFANALLKYEPHPGTAVYLGYTTNFQNLDPALCDRETDGSCNPNGTFLPRTNAAMLNDSRTLYLKMNYLFRF